jgi:small-conductance mechanosensitive channel
MPTLSGLFERTYLHNTLWQWALAAAVIVCVWLLGLLMRRVTRRHYVRLAGTPAFEFLQLPLQVASRTTRVFILVGAIYLGSSALTLPPKLAALVLTALTIAGFWQFGVWCTTALLAWLERKRQTSLEVDRAALGSLGIIGFVLRMLVWLLVLLLTLDNLGVNITTLVAGLGVGGIAVALAVQNVLGDLLASLSITLDRPFVIGDFVIVGEYMGSVEHIGIKSVRLRSLGGEQIVMSNADLLKSRLRNYGRMQERRVVFKIRVSYDTPRDKLQRIPALIRLLIEKQPDTRFDRSHFAGYGDFALDFETVYYVLSAEYNRFMDTQQAVNFGIHDAFEREGIEFGYLSQNYWVAQRSRVAS